MSRNTVLNHNTYMLQRLVARLQNQIGPCSKVFKIISRNLIQKRTEDIKFTGKNKTIFSLGLKQDFVVTIEEINKRHNP